TPVADLVTELDGARERLRGLVVARPLARPQHLAELDLKPELGRAAVGVRPGAAKQLEAGAEVPGRCVERRAGVRLLARLEQVPHGTRAIAALERMVRGGLAG